MFLPTAQRRIQVPSSPNRAGTLWSLTMVIISGMGCQEPTGHCLMLSCAQGGRFAVLSSCGCQGDTGGGRVTLRVTLGALSQPGCPTEHPPAQGSSSPGCMDGFRVGGGRAPAAAAASPRAQGSLCAAPSACTTFMSHKLNSWAK